jgi:Ras-related GTP-binding protein C/D
VLFLPPIRGSNKFPDRYPSSITANSNRQKQVNATAPTPPPSTTSSGSLSPRQDLRAPSSSSTSSYGQQPTTTPQTQGQDQQPLRDTSASPLNPPLPATALSSHNHSQKQVYRNGVDSLSSSKKPYPASVSNPAVQTKSKTRPFFYPSASTSLSTPSSPSGGSTTLTYHLITRHLALLAVIPTTVYEERKGLVEYNVVFFREGVQEICDVENEVRGG